MTLTLRAVSLNELPLSQPITAQFDARGGTIGRADHNTLALPDPERHISRQQAEIQAQPQGGFLIRNIGSANPIVVAGQPLHQGESAPLQPRDEVRIGGYRLEVLGSFDAETGATLLRPAPAPPSAGRLPRDPAEATNPFADLLGMDTPAPPQRSAPAGAPTALLPDDFDPFAARSASAPPPATPSAAPSTDPFADLVPAGPARSLDEMFGLSAGVPAHDALAGFLAGTAEQAPRAASPPATQPDHTPMLQTPFLPRAVPPSPPVRETVAPTPAPTPTPTPAPRPAPAAFAADGSDPLWAAFCAGAGIRPDTAQGDGAERMRLVGELLRAGIEGTMQMLAVRAATRHELRANVTMIRARDNNPLKFSPDAQSVLEQLLRPPLRGFLPAAEAMHDAMHDLVGHTIGSMAGTRAALEGVLARFEPTVLESKLSGRSVLDSVLPHNRKARLWELYLRHFEALREEAREDFHALFGKAFLEAYEAQLQRLDRHTGDKP